MLLLHEGEWLFFFGKHHHMRTICPFPVKGEVKNVVSVFLAFRVLTLSKCLSFQDTSYCSSFSCAQQIVGCEILPLATCSHSHRYIAFLYGDNSPLPSILPSVNLTGASFHLSIKEPFLPRSLLTESWHLCKFLTCHTVQYPPPVLYKQQGITYTVGDFSISYILFCDSTITII